jgi:hypothetical protein
MKMKKTTILLTIFFLSFLLANIVGGAPTVNDPIPRNNAEISIHTTELSIVITNSVNFDYTIETYPDVGSTVEVNVATGVKTVTISGLEHDITYTWWVNATESGTTSVNYTFTTKGLLDFDFNIFNNSVINWGFMPFTFYFDDLLWPFIFVAVVGLTWSTTKHVSTVLASILLTFGAYGYKIGFISSPEISIFFSLVAVLCVAILMLGVFLRKRGDY